MLKKVIKVVRGNAHHVQMISATEHVEEFRDKPRSLPRRMLKRMTRAFKNPPTNAFRVLSVLEGPAILLEYIPNGSLLDLLGRSYEKHIVIPNRVLWSFYFCCKNRLVPDLIISDLQSAVLIESSGEGLRWFGLPQECHGR